MKRFWTGLRHHPLAAAWLAIPLFLVALSLMGATLGWAQDEAPPEAAAPAEPEAEKGAAGEENAEAEPQEQDGAMLGELYAQIDSAFANYLVAPLAKFFFFNLLDPINSTRSLLGYQVDPAEAAPYKLPFIVLWLFCGAVFFTIRMGFINIRAFWHAIRLTKGDYDAPGQAGEVSHFQALSSALSATVGLGNIAGVAIAVGQGGPGAVFWLIAAGLLGMSSKFTECTLGQMYRKIDADGRISGGPMHYLRDGLKEMGFGGFGAVLALMFAIMCVGASFGGGCAFQVSQSLNAVNEKIPFFKDYPLLYGLLMAVAVGLVIIGGIRRIAATAARVVPAMCLIYVVCCLVILGMNFGQIDDAFAKIFSEAFTPQAAYGGFLGVIVIGIQRAAFSNEAGVGSAAIAHSAAKTEEPVSEGIVALLEPFIDTVVVCTMTALVIVITGVYDTGTNPAFANLIQTNQGAALTSAAFEMSVWWFPYVLLVAVVLFAYSTMISWSYYGERCWTSLFGERLSLVYKFIFLGFVLLGSVVGASAILDFSDLMILAMSFPNILGAYFLSGKVKAALNDYWGRLNSGAIQPYARQQASEAGAETAASPTTPESTTTNEALGS